MLIRRSFLATQRDFFTHITHKFWLTRSKPTVEMADRIGRTKLEPMRALLPMIRTSQTQLVAAEKFESIANWLQPQLKYDRQPFDAAWKNILLADSYVWSDANSFKRPESYRTRGGEAAHRAWAEAPFSKQAICAWWRWTKSRNWLTPDQQGTVVFNPESWPRSDFFDFELEPDEALMDPATGQTIPCGVVEVAEWVSGGPLLGV